MATIYGTFRESTFCRAKWLVFFCCELKIYVCCPPPDDIPTQDHSVLTYSLVQKQSDSAKYQFWKSEHTSYNTSPPPILVSLLHSLLILCSFFFFTSCLERRGSCKLTERHWSLSTASADKPASHSALAGGMGHWETQSSLAGSQQSLPAPSGPTQLSTLN